MISAKDLVRNYRRPESHILYNSATGDLTHVKNEWNLSELEVHKENDSLVIDAESLFQMPPVLFYKRIEDNFIMLSNKLEDLVDENTALDSNIISRYKFDNQGIYALDHKSLYSLLPFKGISVISFYDKVTVSGKNINTKSSSIKLLSKPIEDAGDAIKSWIDRYYEICRSHKEQLLADLSSGLDTRIFVYFWKNFRKAVHVCHLKIRNSTVNGNADDSITEFLAKKLDVKLRGEEPRFHLAGLASEPFRSGNLFMNKDFFTTKNMFSSVSYRISPFADKEILQIKPNLPNVLHTALALLLVPDLLSVPFCSGTYTYNSDSLPMKEAKELLKQWKLD